MTFDEYLVQYLVHQGLSPKEARSVVDIMIQETTEMSHRWSDDTEGYPKAMSGILCLTAEHHAVTWLREHKPAHFALRHLERPVA